MQANSVIMLTVSVAIVCFASMASIATAFTCPAGDNDATANMYADPANCAFYYQCSGGIAYHMPCPDGLHFNARLLTCDYPQNAGCTVTVGEGDCQTGGYTVLNDAWRSVNNHVSSFNDWKNIHCDINLPTGWYRIQYNGVDHKIPNYCPLPNVDVPLICGSHVPMWYNGPMPQNAGDVTSGRACGNWYGNCCHFEVPDDIQVKNCGSYFIYRLESTPFCNTTYCAV